MNAAISQKTKPSNKVSILISGLTKRYGRFNAISNIDIKILEGEIHSLVGQNGAGKSTLLGILSGRVAPSDGSIQVYEKELDYGDPRSSRRLGIATIYQELTIIPNLSAVDNVFLGQNISKYGFLSKGKMLERYQELCELMNVTIPPTKIANRLSIADQQMLEIMRGIQLNARILILDEPTASLAPPERKSLLETLKSLRSKGITIIYVSHHLDEVLEISDNVTILRNGEKVITEQRSYWSKDKLVSTMLGEEVGNDLVEAVAVSTDINHKIGREVLRAEQVTVPDAIEDINLTIHAGEIIGIGGLVGSGRSTLVRALAGLEPLSSGNLWIEGKKVKWPKSPRHSIRMGIGFAPEDRKHQGLVLDLSCQDNINMTDLKRIRKWGFYSRKSAGKIAEKLGERFGLTRPIDTICRNLSGGNQQKVLLGKLCNLGPNILIVDEPTRGIDIGVKIDVLKVLKQLANEGMSIIIISSELEEVVAVSDKVLVLSKGRLVKEITKNDEISVGNILNATFKGGTM
ncbi:sugar ABC transporter ATP-binding protein [Neobacillus drentensis]|uniref:sugar ABC transporter ATP-binding protein n=1 Tax=Neobacillus drentensis TaxID=220684 RepID=UPI002FFE749F